MLNYLSAFDDVYPCFVKQPNHNLLQTDFATVPEIVPQEEGFISGSFNSDNNSNNSGNNKDDDDGAIC